MSYYEKAELGQIIFSFCSAISIPLFLYMANQI